MELLSRNAPPPTPTPTPLHRLVSSFPCCSLRRVFIFSLILLAIVLGTREFTPVRLHVVVLVSTFFSFDT